VSGHAGLGAAPAGGETYGGGRAVGGAGYGGAAYGAGAATVAQTYGGSIYANYQFRAQAQPFVAPSPYGPRYAVADSMVEAGAVHGVVVWPQPPVALARLVATAGRSGTCARELENRTLVRGPGGAVADAVVYLEDIQRGRALGGRSPTAPRVLQVGGGIEWRACDLWPHVQISAPIGSMLSLSSVDEAVGLGGVRWNGVAREAHFDVELGAAGVSRDVQLSRSGFVEVRPSRPRHPGRAWVVVAPHPYYVLTDEQGRFALDEVPAGTYTLVVWHEPVIVGTSASGEAIVTAAVETRRRIVVHARREEHVTLKLPPVR
jgi:hypothetical protein